ncbi:MAG: PilC/PilY family type IV pilus protein [Rhodocyclaceae bacterium]|nr:PilC/PilY family type IV pilus protein [Rhodocyclaceae bacterium]
MKILRYLILSLALLPGVANAAFDPVHEDIDIFMANPSIASERPNVLIVLDTSANWQSYFAAEKTALISVINGLSDQFNVGLAINAGGSIEGSYVRFAVRQMTGTNKTALSSLANDLNNAPATSFAGDKTNNAVPGLSMAEAYRYFKGLASYSATTSNAGHDSRTDYSGNATNSWITSLAGNAFSATPNTASTYVSPVVDGCQKNFIIYISNGKGSNQTGEATAALNLLATAKNNDVAATGNAEETKISPLSPTGNETDSWFDEWAKFLAHTGFSMTIGGAAKTITAATYVVEVDPGTQSQDLQWTATLKSGASNGNGKYYAATGSDPGTSLLNALNSIFNEIQAVNSVFASTTLPVSVNVRGTNLNQVYIGMFRPDATKAPRWFGNLKLYKLALNGDALELQDAANVAAESQTTGFIVNTARSYWTHDSTFWAYRSSEENGAGGQSDSPDGDLVEKGAVAQRLREAYASSQSSRKLYTCTDGSYGDCNPCEIDGSGTDKTCHDATVLSSTPFSTANTDITSIALGLGTKDVANLTAKVTKSVTSVADRRNVTIGNSTAGSAAIATASNGATVKTLTALTAFDSTKTMAINSLSGLGNATGTINVSAKANTGSAVTLTFAESGNPCSGKDTVIVAGNDSTVNGTWSITSSAAISNSPARSSVTFTVSSASPSPNTQGTINCLAKTTTATASVTTLPTGLAVNSRINISGASPTAFNGDFQVTAIDTTAKTFSYTTGSSQGAATTAGTLKVYNTVSSGSYSATSTTVRITASAVAHGFFANDSVTLTGVTPTTINGIAVYAGAVTVKTVPSTDSFTYDMSFSGASPLYPPSDATAFGTVYKGATTTVTLTTSSNHGLLTGALADITGLDSCFNTSATAITYLSDTSLSYATASACPPLTSVPAGATVAGSSYSTTVTATLANHGYSVGNSIVIDDGTTAAHNGTFSVASVPDANTFTYVNAAVGGVGPAGQYTVRLLVGPLVYVNAVGHGFSTNDSITVAGANPTGYNGAHTITVVDADNFTYPTAIAIGANTGTTVTASKNTTTAVATSANHGFADNSAVAISGATPGAFNGTFTITSIDVNTFRYTLASAQGDASGTILAAAGTGSSSERDQVINWVRGQDNNEDENGNGSTTDCRASVQGDVLHSRPAVINYNRFGGDNDVYVYYGANDGVFHAIKGGVTTDASDTSGLLPGQEAWGFVPQEAFTNLKRLRNNSPQIGSDFKRPYFMDGPIGVYSIDGNNDTKIQSSTSSDHVYLYVGARRGGRYIYSFDATSPSNPKFRWKIDQNTSGFSELGYSWSLPTVVTGVTGYSNPVLIFGGGYDPTVEDVENCTITGTTAASYSLGVYTPGSVTFNEGDITYASVGTGCTVTDPVSTTVNRGMGRAIYVVDAITGERIWWASYRGSGADLEVAGMDYAIPSDVTVVKNVSGGNTNRAYVGDTGGNLWRLDFGDADRSNWKVTLIAAVGDRTTAAGRRKFLSPPDVVGQTGYDAIVIGAGDREHPFDNTVTNNFYLFKDRGDDTGPASGTTHYLADSDSDGDGDTLTVLTRAGVAADGSGNPVITHSNTTDGQLYNATSNCVQQACNSTTQAAESAKLAAADGWYITLGTGEKVIGNALILNGVVFFNTNQPSQTADASCVANLGVARQYQVSVDTAGAANGSDLGDRSETHAGGGFLPSPVHVVVQVEDAEGNLVTKEGVISGTSVQTPTTGAIGARTRRFWYKEID